ncbi:MAG: hypothetical protein Q8P45_03625 [Candidatus Harrisonbacteria bacterium]|nr:hypothetical protein [Candidatus Harrisonbacteria bacterium]
MKDDEKEGFLDLNDPRIVEGAREIRRKLLEEESLRREAERVGEHETESRCRACSGAVVKVISRHYDPSSGPPIIGPGSRSQYSTSTSYHCGTCGLMYRFPPPVSAS